MFLEISYILTRKKNLELALINKLANPASD